MSCPTTLIVGERDQMTPPKATRELAAALKAQVVTVPTGHHMMAEAPDAVLAALRGALAVSRVQADRVFCVLNGIAHQIAPRTAAAAQLATSAAHVLQSSGRKHVGRSSHQ